MNYLVNFSLVSLNSGLMSEQMGDNNQKSMNLIQKDIWM